MAEVNEQSIRITLRGRNNITYMGTLILSPNWTSNDDEADNDTLAKNTKDYDQRGASYYVIAVVLVYGMSIVMLIASHIKRRQEKLVEDKQINKYLQDFQIVKERHARDSYKNLKRTIMRKINWDRQRRPTYRTLQKSLVPLLAIGMPGAENLTDADAQSLSSSLSNVDLAAAEQYMIAKDKGKVIHSRKPSHDLTAAYFAAARKVSREQSPQILARLYKERRMSRDLHIPVHDKHHLHSSSPYFPLRSPRSRASSFEEPVLEEPEPGTPDQPPANQSFQNPPTHQGRQEHQEHQGDQEHQEHQEPRGYQGHQLHQEDHTEVRVSDKKNVTQVTVDITPTKRSPTRRYPTPKSLCLSPQQELQVPDVWYSNPLVPRSNRSPSPTDSSANYPGQISRNSSQGSLSGVASQKSSPRVSHSSRATTPVLSDGSREELIQVTCV